MKDEISKKMWAHPSHVSFVWLWGENRPLSSTIKELKARKILMRQLCWRKGGAVMFPRRYVQQSANQQMHLWCWAELSYIKYVLMVLGTKSCNAAQNWITGRLCSALHSHFFYVHSTAAKKEMDRKPIVKKSQRNSGMIVVGEIGT